MDSSNPLDQIQTAQSQKEVTANAAFDAVSPSSFGGRRASTTTALTWGYYGGRCYVAGAWTLVANGTISLTASATNYVEFDPVAGSVSSNATGFTAGRIPLYSIVTGAASVTSYTDYRLGAAPVNPLASVSVAGGANVTLTQQQAQASILQCTGALTASINVVVPLAPRQFTVYNGTSGAFTLTFIGTSGTGISVAQGKRAILYSDGTNIVRASADV